MSRAVLNQDMFRDFQDRSGIFFRFHSRFRFHSLIFSQRRECTALDNPATSISNHLPTLQTADLMLGIKKSFRIAFRSACRIFRKSFRQSFESTGYFSAVRLCTKSAFRDDPVVKFEFLDQIQLRLK